MTTTPWNDSVSEGKMRSVQVATALFSLSRFFVEAPTPDIIQRFTDPTMAETWPIRDEDSLAAIARIAEADEPGFALSRDFDAMFGPSGSLMMAESEYTGQKALPLVQTLNKQYAAHGYAPQKTEGYPRDHVAVQLGYLGHLAAKVGDDAQIVQEIRTFRASHLDQYVDDLLLLTEQRAKTHMYRSVVVLIRSALSVLDDMTRVNE